MSNERGAFFCMAKYSSEFKMEVIKSILEDGLSAAEAARTYKVNKGDVLKWTEVYRAHGLNGIEKQRITYTGEFKQKVVEDMRVNSLSLRQTAVKYNLGTHVVVSKWERIYLEEGPEGLYIERRGRASMADGTRKGRPPKLNKEVEEDLIAENQRLRAENDYLKKLNALVSERVQREKKLK